MNISLKKSDTAPPTPPRIEPCSCCAVREIAICSSLEGCNLAILSDFSHQRKISAGATIFREGDPARHYYNVIEGTIRLVKLLPNGRRQVTGFLFAGDFLGLGAREDYSYSAEAISDGLLCEFDEKSFRDFAERVPQMTTALLDRANAELWLAQEQLLLLGRKTPMARLASFLLRFSDRLNKSEFALTITREDIADYLGLTIETVSRCFTKLKTSGMIRLAARNEVRILDRDALTELAEDAS